MIDLDGYDRLVTQRMHTTFDDQKLDLAYAGLGLSGESGEVVELIKKSLRKGDHRRPLAREELALELSDVLFYASRLATLHGMSLMKVLEVGVAKLVMRRESGKDPEAELSVARGILADT